MSKRNFILLIIIIILAIASVFGFFYFKQKTNNPTEEGTPDTNFIAQFNPFGSRSPSPTPTSNTNNTVYQPDDNNQITEGKLSKVSSMPIAGFTPFTKERLKNLPTTGEGEVVVKTTKPETEFVGAVRYVEKASGNIYQTFLDKREEQRFSSTIIPKVYEAFFGSKGESVVMRYLKEDGKTIETFTSVLPKELVGAIPQVNEIKGSFLPNNVQDISVSPDASKIFYLFTNENNQNDSIIGTILTLANNKKVQIFSSPFTEWLSWWGSNNIITLTTKPSAKIPGYMYTIDASGKNLTKVLGSIDGLTTLMSPNGKMVLYGDSNLNLNIYQMDKRNSDVISLKTLPEKCVWGRGSDIIFCAVPKSVSVNEYPDSWYQGLVSFNDQIWKIDIKTGNTSLVMDPATEVKGEEIDGVKLVLDESESYLFFINKKDSFLWKLNLK